MIEFLTAFWDGWWVFWSSPFTVSIGGAFWFCYLVAVLVHFIVGCRKSGEIADLRTRYDLLAKRTEAMKSELYDMQIRIATMSSWSRPSRGCSTATTGPTTAMMQPMYPPMFRYAPPSQFQGSADDPYSSSSWPLS